MSKLANDLKVYNLAISPEVSADLLPEPETFQEDGNGKVKVYLQLIQLSPDPQQFKPYSPQLRPPENQPILVQIELLQRYVKEQRPDGTLVLSANGLAKIAQLICTGISKIHVEE